MWWIDNAYLTALSLVSSWTNPIGTPLSPAWRTHRSAAQSTVEYALVGALVVIAAAAALTILGEQVNAVFGSISNTLRAAATSAH